MTSAELDDLRQVVDNDTFLENAAEARSNGFDRLCSQCGVGVFDSSDIHERRCPEFVEPDYR